MFHRMMNYGELEAKPTVSLSKDAIRKNLPKFKRHEDLIIIQEQAWEELKRALPMQVTDNENSPFSIDEDELASLVCQTVQKPACHRLAIERRVNNDDYRSPSVRMILGSSSIVRHKDNHITYQFDVTKCMFSFGNVSEKLRMATLDCSNEVVVDLFAGIGYFSLPLLVHSGAKHLYACEWNPDSVEALKRNLILNKIAAGRYTVIEGDNRLNRPLNVAQRVLLGILPSCLDYLKTAVECADRRTGAMLHCHDLVETKPPDSSCTDLGNDDGLCRRQKTLTNPSAQSTNSSIELDSANASAPASVCQNDNQSFASVSISSHSTIEKLSVNFEENQRLALGDETNATQEEEEEGGQGLAGMSTATTDGDSLSGPFPPENGFDAPKDGSSKQPESTGAVGGINGSCHSASNSEENTDGPVANSPNTTDNKTTQAAYQTRAQFLLDHLMDTLEAHNLTASLASINPVKSYAPHMNHVVFDIRLEPRREI